MIEEPVLVDTGALIALYNERDSAHQACIQVAHELPVGKAYTCWPVVTEASYLLRKYPEQQDALLDALTAGDFQLQQLAPTDLPVNQKVFSTYGDQQVDLADAALVHLTNREGISTVFATDLRHFRVYQLESGKYFRILPVDV